ncbi:MAG: ATP-binding protein [Planctomycetota bacterium]
MKIRTVRFRILIALSSLAIGCMGLFTVGSLPILSRISDRELARELEQGRHAWLTFYEQRSGQLRQRLFIAVERAGLEGVDPRAPSDFDQVQSSLDRWASSEEFELAHVIDPRAGWSGLAESEPPVPLPPRPQGSTRSSTPSVGVWWHEGRYFLAASCVVFSGDEPRCQLVIGDPIDTIFARDVADATGLDVALVLNREILGKSWHQTEHPLADDLATRAIQIEGLLETDTRSTLAQPLPGMECFVVISVASHLLEGLSRAILLSLLAVGALASLLALVVSRFLARYLSQPIRELTEAAATIRNGDFSVELPVRGDDEIGQCTEAFNRMARRTRTLVEELQVARTEAEEANQSKTEFLANTSHELRTPMTAILGFAAELRNPDLDPRDRTEFADTLHEQAEHLLGIINDVLDYSSLESGSVELALTGGDVRAIVDEAVALVSPRATAKQLPVYVRVDPTVPPAIQTDPARLRQVLMHLLDNAIKFTETGYVRIAVETTGDEEAEPKIAIQVEDSGRGMSETEAAHAFDAFVQADASTTRRHGGTGLGLALCKQLVERLDGSIRCTSELGRGSQFDVELPLIEESIDPSAPVADEDEVEAPRRHRLSGIRVLLVDDCDVNKLLIRRILEREGCAVSLGSNGQEAFDEAIDALADRPFDVVLVDMQMPIKDGYQATRELRAASYELPIVAITSHAMDGDRERCLEAGCDDYLSKPVDWAQLVQTIRRLSSRRAVH